MTVLVAHDGWALGAEELVKSFAGRAVLRGVGLHAAPGTLTVVRGAPRSGRTTLIRCLTGTYRPSGGRITLSGAHAVVDLTTLDARGLAWVRRHRLAVLDGLPAAPPRTTTVVAVARTAGVEAEVARSGLARLGADHLADVAMGRLRPEQARCVGLVAALVQPGAVVLLDDPLEATDSVAVRAWIDERRGGGDAVVVTAPMEQVWEADASGVLHEGTVRWWQG